MQAKQIRCGTDHTSQSSMQVELEPSGHHRFCFCNRCLDDLRSELAWLRAQRWLPSASRDVRTAATPVSVAP
jgi:hypothetical protein